MAASTDPRWRNTAVSVIEGYGTAADPADSTAAARRAFQELDGVVSDLMGRAGLNALTDRALYLARREFPDAIAGSIATHTKDGLTSVAESIVPLPAPQAREAAIAVLGVFAALLAAFLGNGLAMQLLRQAWPAVLGNEGAEEKPQ